MRMTNNPIDYNDNKWNWSDVAMDSVKHYVLVPTYERLIILTPRCKLLIFLIRPECDDFWKL